MGKCSSVDIVLGELGKLDEYRHHDGGEEVDQVLEVAARLVRRWRLGSEPVVLGLLEEGVHLLRDVGDDAVLGERESVLEGGKRVEVDGSASLSSAGDET